MIPKELSQINERTIQDLITNSIAEAKTIEYKRELKISSDGEKKEFLADVSSFANADGGDLIIGIEENQGIPKAISGLDIKDLDAEKLKIEQILASGIQPRLPSIVIHPVKFTNSRSVLVIRVGKSWVSPHRVVLVGHDKFYSRSSAGKFQMDVGELRIAFNLSDTLNDKIKHFRKERISRIYSEDIPIPMDEGAKIVLHLIPLVSFSPGKNFDILNLNEQKYTFTPIYGSGWSNRINLDGRIVFSRDQKLITSYTQLYRNGIIEAVNANLLAPSDDNKLFIPSGRYEKELIRALYKYLRNLESLGVEPPIIVFISLTRVKNYHMFYNKSGRFIPIDRDLILLPEIVVENYDQKPEVILKPCFDQIWNACGESHSFNYNGNTWIGERL